MKFKGKSGAALRKLSVEPGRVSSAVRHEELVKVSSLKKYAEVL